jgi:hypothetical protein
MGLLPSWFTVQVAFAPLPLPFFQALREIEVETAIGQASIFRLHFDLSRTMFGDYDALAVDLFRPLLPVKISVAAGLPIPQTLINGYIVDSTLNAGQAPGTSRFEVVGMDALGTLMTNQQTVMPRPNLSNSEIAALIFGGHAIIPQVEVLPRTRTERDTTTIQRAYDAQFLMGLARFHNFELYIQPDPFTGLDIGHLHRPLIDLPHQGVLSIDFGMQTNLTQFSVSNSMLKPTSVVGASLDRLTRFPMMALAPSSNERAMGADPLLRRIFPPPVARQARGCIANPAEAQLRADAEAAATSRAIMAQGEVDGLKFARPLRAGLSVMVRGAGKQNSGQYYVQSVTHRISRDDYRQSFTAWRNAVGLTGTETFFDVVAALG